MPSRALARFIGHRVHLKLTRTQIGKLISLKLATGLSILWKAFAVR
jgi:hypothetical protein